MATMLCNNLANVHLASSGAFILSVEYSLDKSKTIETIVLIESVSPEQNLKQNVSRNFQSSALIKRLYKIRSSLPTTRTCGEKLVLKFTNMEESKNPEMIELQTDTMIFMHHCSQLAQMPVQNIRGNLLCLEELEFVPKEETGEHMQTPRRKGIEPTTFLMQDLKSPSTTSIDTSRGDIGMNFHLTIDFFASVLVAIIVPMMKLGKMKTKPNLSESQVVDLVKKLYHLTVTDVQPLPSFDDQNFYVAASDGREYVFKILNSEWTENTTLVGVQTDTMSFLRQDGLPVQNTLPNFQGELICCEELDCGFGPQMYLVRLLTYLPGVTISKVPPSPQLLLEVGRMAAKIDHLQKMEHPHLCALLRTEFRWSLSRVPILQSYLRFLDEGPVLEMVKSVIQQYETSVAPKYPNFRKCINHGDLNELNILVEPDEKNNFRVSGVLDFVDMTSGYFIHELAITIAHMSTLYCNPAEAGGPVLAGFTSVFPLNEAERDCLYILVLSRLCQVSVLPCYFITMYPENSEYIMGMGRMAAGVLSRLWEQGKERVEKIWFQSAAELNQLNII
ncbi:LOW QUALITY PROTEIN: hydroxylysine kinase-like [Synchiropus picturatus]